MPSVFEMVPLFVYVVVAVTIKWFGGFFIEPRTKEIAP